MAAPWQNSWDSFVDTLNERLRTNEAADALAEYFGGKPVTWEGVLDEKYIDEEEAVVTVALPSKRIDLGHGRSASLDSVSLPVSEQSVAEWQSLELGTRVVFSAVLGSTRSIFPPVQVKHFKSGECGVAIHLRDGILVEKGNDVGSKNPATG